MTIEERLTKVEKTLEQIGTWSYHVNDILKKVQDEAAFRGGNGPTQPMR